MRGYEEAINNILFKILRNEKESRIQRKDTSNILSFIGERGSGKTTAMREFCKILNEMNRAEVRFWWVNRAISDNYLREDIHKKKLFFKVLEPIDASTMEAKEDLFELILAMILNQYESEVKTGKAQQYEQLEIRESFVRIMEGYHAIKNARNEDFGDSYITRLKYMSSSMEIKRNIELLVKRLLKYWGDVDEYSFLVIAIDDLDLNIQGGYEMLAQLHKYFSDSNIIIALAVCC